jgi:hypothetical protein
MIDTRLLLIVAVRYIYTGHPITAYRYIRCALKINPDDMTALSLERHVLTSRRKL